MWAPGKKFVIFQKNAQFLGHFWENGTFPVKNSDDLF